MEKLIINGAFADSIRNMVEYNNTISNKILPKWMLTKELEADENSSKEKVIDLFMKCDSFSIQEG